MYINSILLLGMFTNRISIDNFIVMQMATRNQYIVSNVIETALFSRFYIITSKLNENLQIFLILLKEENLLKINLKQSI